MKIEAGKYYRKRSGDKAYVAARLPMVLGGGERWVGSYTDEGDSGTWQATYWYEGGYYSKKPGNNMDLVEPWDDEPAAEPKPEKPQVQKWEYKWITSMSSNLNRIDELGTQGWELVTCDRDNYLCFKRPLNPKG